MIGKLRNFLIEMTKQKKKIMPRHLKMFFRKKLSVDEHFSNFTSKNKNIAGSQHERGRRTGSEQKYSISEVIFTQNDPRQLRYLKNGDFAKLFVTDIYGPFLDTQYPTGWDFLPCIKKNPRREPWWKYIQNENLKAFFSAINFLTLYFCLGRRTQSAWKTLYSSQRRA